MKAFNKEYFELLPIITNYNENNAFCPVYVKNHPI